MGVLEGSKIASLRSVDGQSCVMCRCILNSAVKNDAHLPHHTTATGPEAALATPFKRSPVTFAVSSVTHTWERCSLGLVCIFGQFGVKGNWLS